MLQKGALVAVLVALALLETYVSAALFPFHRHTYMAYPGSNGLFLLAVFMSFTLVAIGAVCFVSPKTAQDYALKQNSKWLPQNPFLHWMKTVKYLWFLRFVGVFVFIAGSCAAFVLVKEMWETVFI
jgi:hypothetical protein